MPELSRFGGIIIKMLFNDTVQHNKPVPLSRDLSRHKRSGLPLLSVAKVNLLRFLDI